MRIDNFAAVLGRNPLFATLPEDEREAVASSFTPQLFQLGDVVIRQGDEAGGFYIVYSGKARVVDESSGRPTTIAVLGPGDGFGERALLYGTPRSHTVRAAGPLMAFKLSTVSFASLVAKHPHLSDHLDTQIRRNEEFNFLRTLGLLSHLTLPQTESLLARLQAIHLNDGDVLLREGDDGQSCYLVRDGQLRAMAQTATGQRQVGVLKRGDLIGEMSLLYDRPRSATIVAGGRCVVLELTKELFDEFIDTTEARETLFQQVTNRLLQNETLLAQHGSASDRLAAPVLRVQTVRLKEGWFSRPYPFVHSADAVFDGLACLLMVDRWNARPATPQKDLDRKVGEGVPDTLLTVSRKAEDRGYLTRLLGLRKDDLASAPLPAIVETPSGGLAVLFRVGPKSVIVADPRQKLKVVPRKLFEESWNGRLLSLASVPNFAQASLEKGKAVAQLIPFLMPFRSVLGAVLAASLLGQLLGLAQPLFRKVIVDDVLVSGDSSLLLLLLFGMLLVTAFQMAAGTLRQYLSVHLLRRVSAAMQLRFFHHILWLTQKAASRWQTGDLTVRFQENEKLLTLVSQSGMKIVIDSVMAATYIAVLFTVNASLATATLPFIIGTVLLLFLSSSWLRAAERRVFARRQDSESHVIETVTGIQTLKSLAVERQRFGLGQALITDLKTKECRFADLSFNVSMFSSILNQAATIVVLGYGAQLALKGKLTTGELVAFQALLAATMAPLMSLVQVWDELQEIRISFERTADVLRAETETNAPDAVAPALQGHVEFRNVGFRYEEGQPNVLSGISIEALPGQKVALVGRSGSGKSSLASLLLNLYQPTEGSIVVDGVDLSNIDRSVLRRQIGVVEQQPFLFSGTIRENIAKTDPAASLDRVVAAATAAGAHPFIEALPRGYDTPVGERGMTLSGGQKQRIVIARALLNSPRMLVLDEATSALDTESERIIQRNLDNIMEGRTTFVIAHRLSTVANADLIVVLDEGRIVETGTHQGLLERHGLYAYLNAAAA